MKKCLKICIWILLPISFIMTGCARDNSAENQPGSDDSHLYSIDGRVTEIVGKNTVLINVLKENSHFQKEDIVVVKYDVSQESEVDLEGRMKFEIKQMEVQMEDIVYIQYAKNERKKRDIGKLKDCNYIRTNYLYIIQR